MTPLYQIASNFGTDEITARKDAERLSASLDMAVVIWKDRGSWYCVSITQTIGHKLDDFPHEIIKSK